MKSHRLHASFAAYKDDICKVISLIEHEIQDNTTHKHKHADTISYLIDKYRHQQKLTSIGITEEEEDEVVRRRTLHLRRS